jgi:hypothetical protein
MEGVVDSALRKKKERKQSQPSLTPVLNFLTHHVEIKPGNEAQVSKMSTGSHDPYTCAALHRRSTRNTADPSHPALAPSIHDPNSTTFANPTSTPTPSLSPPPHTTKMSKHVKDATRFTATGVWAHTRPGGRATTLQFADPAPKNETPQQKVKRLREAANRAKMAQVTRWDYAYLYGRMAADAAHRFTVYGLIFATGTFPNL